MKLKNISDTDMAVRGVDFPSGKVVSVDDESLATKVSNMPQFEVVKTTRKAKANDKNKA